MQTTVSARPSRWLWAAVVLIALLALGARLFGQAGEAALTPPPENYYAAGNRLEVRGPILGDALLAGREIIINQPVDGDVLGAGWRVTLNAAAHDDVRVAGGNVTLTAPVDGDVTIAGGEVATGPAVRVAGRSWISGGTVHLEGAFARDLRVAGRIVQIGGEVQGPVEVTAETVEIFAGARLHGPLVYRSPKPATIAAGAVLNGPVVFKQIESNEPRRASSFRGVSSVLFAVHLLAAGLVLVALLPRTAGEIATTLRQQPGRSLLAGFALLVTLPAAAVVLTLSILGLPLGLAIMALYLVALLAGLVTTALVVGQLEASWWKNAAQVTRGRNAGFVVAGVLTLAVLRALPIVGAFVVFVSVLFGLGALTLWTCHAYARTHRAFA
jgi:cytoskeletal protein CcmA (bactofilin family)